MPEAKPLGHFDQAMRMRDAIRGIAKQEFDKHAEQGFIGWALDSRFDVSPEHNLNMGHIGIPTRMIKVATEQTTIVADDGTIATDDDGSILYTPRWDIGVIQAYLPPPLEILNSFSIVRIEGRPGAYRVAEILEDTINQFAVQHPGNMLLHRTFLDLQDSRYMFDGRGTNFPNRLSTTGTDGIESFGADHLYPISSGHYQRLYAPTIAAGNCVSLGFWSSGANEPFEHSALVNGVLRVWIGVDTRNQQSATPYVEDGVITRQYVIPLGAGPGARTWTKVVPVNDSGFFNGMNFDLEVYVYSGTVFTYPTVSMRLRLNTLNTARVPRFLGGVFSEVEGDGWYYNTNDELLNVNAGDIDVAAAVPTQVWGQFQNVTASNEGEYGTFSGNGPFLSPSFSYAELSQTLLTGGGNVMYASGRLGWTQNWLVAGAGKNTWCPDGRFESGVPSGVARNVPVFGSSAGTSVAMSAGGIPLAAGQALYWELPLAKPYNYNSLSSSSGFLTNFRIVDYSGTARFEVPSHWVCLAMYNGDNGNIKLGNGQTISSGSGGAGSASGLDQRWHTFGAYNEPAYSGGSSQYTAVLGAFGLAQMSLDALDTVWLSGLLNAPTATNTAMFTLPAGYRPLTQVRFAVASAVGMSIIEISTAGVVTFVNGTLGGYLSLDGINFPADDLYPTAWSYPGLTSPFTIYSGNTPRIWMDSVGAVHMGGQVAASPTTTVGTIFTLPVAMRPDVPKIFMVAADTGLARIDISTAGVVAVTGYSTGGSALRISLDGIVLPPISMWSALTLGNSWIAYGGGFATAGYAVDPNGIVRLRGLIKSGTAASLFWAAGSLPAYLRPRGQIVSLAGASANKYARVDTLQSGGAQQVAFYDSGTNAYLCLDGIQWKSQQAGLG